MEPLTLSQHSSHAVEFTAKLFGARKERRHVVRLATNGKWYINNDTAIGRFDPETGEGIWNPKSPYFPALAMRDTRPAKLPEELRAAIAKDMVGVKPTIQSI